MRTLAPALVLGLAVLAAVVGPGIRIQRPAPGRGPSPPFEASRNASSEAPAPPPRTKGPRTTPVGHEFIVSFKSYLHAEEHERRLRASVGEEASWQVIPRKNAAAAFPTDFLLVRFASGASGQKLLDRIRADPEVRHIVPQRRIVDPLLSLGLELGAAGPGTDPLGRAPWRSRKGTGRAFSFEDGEGLPRRAGNRRRLLEAQITTLLNAEHIWSKGMSGKGVKVAIFDTGLKLDHPHFRNIKERSNWTDEDTLDDGLGHGTFVAGVVASHDGECKGFAPDVDIHIFRVFTNGQVSYTSWFLDAFNYAIRSKVNVLNLSIGGPDFMDRPFVDKVNEMAANNIIVVSAIGNDGPLYGTLNNPADQTDVIGVGGIDFDESIASFSSRGMTSWEGPDGYGRPKPDLVAFGRNVYGSRMGGGCRSLSGTSVASPVVCGAVALLSSVVPEDRRWKILNPASMKQALVESAQRVKTGANLFEQGAGKLNLVGAYDILASYRPRASLHPKALDLSDCPYMWPFCTQPLYARAQPVVLNVTILNGMGLTGRVAEQPVWTPGENGDKLQVSVSYPERIWPWTGYLGVHITVADSADKFDGFAEGVLTVKVASPGYTPDDEELTSTAELPIRAKIIPTPERSRRILWDQFHNLQYPPGYMPRDNLNIKDDVLDWNGDHPHTNYRGAYSQLRENGYFVELLGRPLTCFDATQYGALLLVDSEEEYFPEEVAKLKQDVEEKGLGVVIFADWYNDQVVVKLKFFDDNTRSWWTPVTGGANVPALNELLAPFGAALGDVVYAGRVGIGSHHHAYSSGTHIIKWPAGGTIHRSKEVSDQGAGFSGKPAVAQADVPVMGVWESKGAAGAARGGRLLVYGDSNCLDEAHLEGACYGLLLDALRYAVGGPGEKWPHGGEVLSEPFDHKAKIGWGGEMPVRQGPEVHDWSTGVLIANDLELYSRVYKRAVSCPNRATRAASSAGQPTVYGGGGGGGGGDAGGGGGGGGGPQEPSGGSGAGLPPSKPLGSPSRLPSLLPWILGGLALFAVVRGFRRRAARGAAAPGPPV